MADWSWNDARIERLKKLWADGYSASQVSRKLAEDCEEDETGPTRSAIVGKVHRLKLPARKRSGIVVALPKQIKAPALVPEPTPAPAKPALPKKSAFPETPRAKNQFDIAKRAAIAANEPGLPAKYATKPTGEGVSILELTDGNCHWPLGDPRNLDFEFCGRPAALKSAFRRGGRSRNDNDVFAPYCLGHCLIAYRPPEDRKRQADEDKYLPNRARVSR